MIDDDDESAVERRMQEIMDATGLDAARARQIALRELAAQQQASIAPQRISPSDLPLPRLPPSPNIGSDGARNCPEPEPDCRTCHGARWIVLDGRGLTPCVCLQAARQQRHADVQRARISALQQRLAAQMGRLARCTLSNFNPERPLSGQVPWEGRRYAPADQQALLKRACLLVTAFVEGPVGWLYLVGPYGAGKSHLAAAALNALAADGTGAIYVSAPDLGMLLREGFSDKTYTSEQRLTDLQEVPVLLIDDLGAEYRTEWLEEKFFLLLNARYLHDRVTLITSNVPLAQLSGRLQSRIRGQAATQPAELLVVASDYREIPR